MPSAFLTFLHLVTGYLNGAGLGALLFSFYPGAAAHPDLELALIALLILGPAGALIAHTVARGVAQDHAAESLPREH
jgi:hypothetical protein